MTTKRLSAEALADLRKKGPQNFTDNFLKNLIPGPVGVRYSVADTQCPGLKVRVTDKGRKVFVLSRRVPGKSEASATARKIGLVGAISLADAREKAREWVRLIETGKDPAEVKRAQDMAEAKEKATAEAQVKNTFGKAVRDRYFPHIAHQRRAKDVKNEFEHDLLPGWEDKPIHEFTRKEIRERVRGIARRTSSQAYAALSNLKTFFNWWRDQEDLETVPTDNMRAKNIVGNPRTHRKRVLSNDELFALWRATRPERWREVKAKAWSLSRPDSKVIASGIRVLLLTAARVTKFSRLISES